MTVKVIVLSEEDYAKLPKGINILQEQTHESEDHFNLSSTLADMDLIVQNLELSEEKNAVYEEEKLTIAHRFLNNHSFSSYNEHLEEVILEVIDENLD